MASVSSCYGSIQPMMPLLTVLYLSVAAVWARSPPTAQDEAEWISDRCRRYVHCCIRKPRWDLGFGSYNGVWGLLRRVKRFGRLEPTISTHLSLARGLPCLHRVGCLDRPNSLRFHSCVPVKMSPDRLPVLCAHLSPKRRPFSLSPSGD